MYALKQTTEDLAMTDLEKYNKMQRGAWLGKSGRGTLNGRLVQFKSRPGRGTSGKLRVTTWYIDGQRVAKKTVDDMMGLIHETI